MDGAGRYLAVTIPGATQPDAPQPDDEQPPRPEHDTVLPALDDDPEPDERQPKPAETLAQDDELRAGQWGPDAAQN